MTGLANRGGELFDADCKSAVADVTTLQIEGPQALTPEPTAQVGSLLVQMTYLFKVR